MKLGPTIGIAIIVLALGLGAYFFKNSLTPYLSFSVARASSAEADGGTVQIMGVPVKNDTQYDLQSGTLDFVLQEPGTGDTMPVQFKSPKPDNFDQAVQVGAIGRYDSERKVFEADNLLVKCPSKYAGQKAPATGPRSYTAS
jgi:cytochrome c-type biogenesis protein CcmE